MPTCSNSGVDIPSGCGFHGHSRPPLRGGDPPANWAERANFCDTQRNAYPVKWHKSGEEANAAMINGSELYYLGSDPVSAAISATIQTCRCTGRAYEAWC